MFLCPYGAAGLPLEGFPCNLVLDNFFLISLGNLSFIEIGQH